jgi:hypothetical protein
MRAKISGTSVAARWAIVFAAGLFGPTGAESADKPPQAQKVQLSVDGKTESLDLPRGHVFLPPNSGATALSALIEAEAKLIVAQGDFLESIGIARVTHAKAVDLELNNRLRSVDVYFEARRKNRWWRQLENPTHRQVLDRHEQLMRDQIQKCSQPLFEGNMQGTLNWLRAQLVQPSLIAQVLADGMIRRLQHIPVIPPDHLDVIWLKDSSAEGGTGKFRAAGGTILDRDWPFALRSKECAAACRDFERLRRQVTRELKQVGHVPHETGEQLLEGVDGLRENLEKAYPSPERLRDVRKGHDYSDAWAFLDQLEKDVRVLRRRPAVLLGGNTFAGQHVVELVRHMYERGLWFAPPEDGDRGAYQKLYDDLLTLYWKLKGWA